jgi:hypothetical protein
MPSPGDINSVNSLLERRTTGEAHNEIHIHTIIQNNTGQGNNANSQSAAGGGEQNAENPSPNRRESSENDRAIPPNRNSSLGNLLSSPSSPPQMKSESTQTQRK